MKTAINLPVTSCMIRTGPTTSKTSQKINSVREAAPLLQRHLGGLTRKNNYQKPVSMLGAASSFDAPSTTATLITQIASASLWVAAAWMGFRLKLEQVSLRPLHSDCLDFKVLNHLNHFGLLGAGCP